MNKSIALAALWGALGLTGCTRDGVDSDSFENEAAIDLEEDSSPDQIAALNESTSTSTDTNTRTGATGDAGTSRGAGGIRSTDTRPEVDPGVGY